MNIRPASIDDVDRITDIENRSFSAPFTKEMYTAMVKASPPFYGLAAIEADALVGYLFYSVGADEMELLTIAVEERFRKKGIARAILKEMLKEARECSIRSVFLEVRPSNTAALSLYKDLGFTQMGVRKGYYKDNNEDALTLKLEIV